MRNRLVHSEISENWALHSGGMRWVLGNWGIFPAFVAIYNWGIFPTIT